MPSRRDPTHLTSLSYNVNPLFDVAATSTYDRNACYAPLQNQWPAMCRFAYHYYAECHHQETLLVNFCANAREASALTAGVEHPASPSSHLHPFQASTFTRNAAADVDYRELAAALPWPTTTASPRSRLDSSSFAIGYAEPSILTISNQGIVSDPSSLHDLQPETDTRQQKHPTSLTAETDMSHITGLTFSQGTLSNWFSSHAQTAQPSTTTVAQRTACSASDLSQLMLTSQAQAQTSTLGSHGLRECTGEKSNLPTENEVISRSADPCRNVHTQCIDVDNDEDGSSQKHGRSQATPDVSAAARLQQQHEAREKNETRAVHVTEPSSVPELASTVDFPALASHRPRSHAEEETPSNSKQSSPRFALPTKAFSIRTQETICRNAGFGRTATKKSPQRMFLPVDWTQGASHGIEQSPPVSPKTSKATSKSNSPSYMSPTKATMRRNVATVDQENTKLVSPRVQPPLLRLKTTSPQLKVRARSPTIVTSASSECIITEVSKGSFSSHFERSKPVQVTMSTRLPAVPNTRTVRRDSHGSIILPIQQKLNKWGLLSSRTASLSSHISSQATAVPYVETLLPQAPSITPRISQHLKSALRAEAKEFTPLSPYQGAPQSSRMPMTDMTPPQQIIQGSGLPALAYLGRAPMPILPHSPPTTVSSPDAFASSKMVPNVFASPTMPTMSPSSWTFSSPAGSDNDHWSGGDGREIKFIGNGARAERFFAHSPFKRQAQHASLKRFVVDGSSPRFVGAGSDVHYMNGAFIRHQPPSPPLAPRSRKQWAQMIGASKVPCGDMEVVHASEQGLHGRPNPESQYWGFCSQCATTPR